MRRTGGASWARGLLGVTVALAACGPLQEGQGTPIVTDVAEATPAATLRPAGESSAPPAAETPPAETPPAETPPAATAPPAEAVDEDERLLAVLPEAVDGVPVQLESLAFEEARTQPDFATSIGSAVFFVVPGPDDLVSGLVARPRDGVHSDAWYRDWRETYDDGACGQAGGVGGRAEAVLDGRPVSITTCAGGMRVYHAWVAEQGVVVSLIALGDGRWGEQLMASLRA